MKKLICVLISIIVFMSVSSVNVFALQDDVYKVYKNELDWLYKTDNIENYCVYDMDKDGIKELIVKTGTCEADYVYRFYTCEYGKIISLGTFTDAIHTGLYECDTNGVFVFFKMTGNEALWRVSKTGHKIAISLLFSVELKSGTKAPKRRIDVTSIGYFNNFTYAGLH